MWEPVRECVWRPDHLPKLQQQGIRRLVVPDPSTVRDDVRASLEAAGIELVTPSEEQLARPAELSLVEMLPLIFQHR